MGIPFGRYQCPSCGARNNFVNEICVGCTVIYQVSQDPDDDEVLDYVMHEPVIEDAYPEEYHCPECGYVLCTDEDEIVGILESLKPKYI